MSLPWSPFLRLFLPAATLIVLGTWLVVDNGREARLSEVQGSEAVNVRLGAGILERQTQGVLQDLKYLGRHNASHLAGVSEGDVAWEEMGRDFVDFLATHPVYDQMRWLDETGQERLRVDLVDGQPRQAPREHLQNKADRYYFSETMRLPPGEVYISPIDLNVERGKISEPYKPSLRLAMPVADDEGVKRGMIVLNFQAATMIARLKAAVPNVHDRLMLVNAAGYFIVAPDPADEWGFMFGDARRTLVERHPASWSRIDRGEAGQFVDADGLWTFQTVYPRQAIRSLGLSGDSRADQVTEEELHAARWHVVTLMPEAQLHGLLREGEGVKLAIAGGLLLLAAGGGVMVAQARGRERQAEQRFRMYFEQARVGMGVSAPDRRWLAVNPELCAIFKYSADELLARTWSELTHPDDLAANVVMFNSVLRGESDGYTLEKRFLRGDGGTVDVSIAARVVRKADGRPEYFIVVVEDISRRIRAEKDRQSSLETLSRFIDNFPGIAYIKDEQSRLRFVSRQALHFLGKERDDLVGRRTEDIFPGDLGLKLFEDDQRILASGQAEVASETYGGHHFETIKFLIPHGDGPASLGGIAIDVTERRRNEQKLALFAARSAALLAMPAKGRELPETDFMRHVLDVAEDLTGSRIGFMHFVNADQESIELIAWSTRTLDYYCRAVFDRHYPISQAGIWADAARLKEPVVINDYAAVARPGALPEGHSHLERLVSIPVMEGDLVRMMMGVGNKPGSYDDTDVETLQLLGSEAWRILSQQRAVNALELANQVVVASPVVSFRWAAADGWPVIFVSDNVTRWGYTPEALKAGDPPFAELIHPDDRPRIAAEVAAKTAAGCRDYEQEYRILTCENKAIWVVDRTSVHRDADGRVLYFDGVLTDITERKAQQLKLAATLAEQKLLNKRLEEAHNQLLQSEKMASIGQLAAGVAHELNNPIGFVHSNLGTLDGYVRDLMEIIAAQDALVEAELPDSPAARRIGALKVERDFDYIVDDIGSLLDESKDGLARVRKIVLDLKNFSHAGEQAWQSADLHQGLDSTLNIVWNELKYKCKVVKEYGELPKVSCMISQLNQVFMNLLVNAAQAIDTRGKIVIRTGTDADAAGAVAAVWVEIEDSGRGMSPEVQKRLYEPFFTTKPVGKGTGLGLSISFGIIEKHHGRIDFRSEPGRGTTFRVSLPVDASQAGAAAS